MFKNLLFGLLALLALLSCTSGPTENECKKFKTGVFSFRLRQPDKDYFFTISRNDSIQTEVDETTGYVSKLRIHWLDPCNYELEFLESTAPMPDSIIKLKKAVRLQTKITGVTDAYYLFESQSKLKAFEGLVLKDTMWVKR